MAFFQYLLQLGLILTFVSYLLKFLYLILVLIYNTSDFSSSISCDYSYVIIRTSIFCKIWSRIEGRRSFALSSSYILTVNSSSPALIGSFSTSLSQHPYVSQEFIFDWTAKDVTGPWKIIDSLTGAFANLFVLGMNF